MIRGERYLDVIPPFQPLGDNLRHLVIFSREGTEGFKQHQAFYFFRKRRGIQQAHAAAQRVTDDRQPFFLQML